MGLFDFSFGLSQGGGIDVGASKDLMHYQSQQWRGNTKWYNLNGYNYLRQGLINADYNPILALGSSPLNGAMPNAAATEGTTSFSGSATPSANMQANTARKVSESQILVNKATANKTAEEALTQDNIRNNLDSQSALNLLKSEEIQRLLPFKERKMIADILVADSIAEMNNMTTAYVPFNAETNRIHANAATTSANAADRNATVNEQWTPAKIVAGSLAGLIGAVGLGKFSKFKPFMKNAQAAKKALGKNSYRSSSAEYFTTLH